MKNHIKAYRADSLLLLTAMIWGFAFVAQRAGMDHVGPFTYNAFRFALGGLSLLPLLALPVNRRKIPGRAGLKILYYGSIAGVVIFIASSFQQVGLQYTTAGNAGFITGLYVIIVPILGLLWRQKAGTGVWIGAVLAVAGMYFLSIQDGLRINHGDLLVLICAFFFAIHVIVVGWLSPKFNAVRLSIMQFLIASALSFVVAIFREEVVMTNVLQASLPIAYGGIFSAGVAYTLQIFAQKEAPAGHAAIILSLESVFAVFGGWLILNESVTERVIIGCALMLAGMLSAQYQQYRIRRKQTNQPA